MSNILFSLVDTGAEINWSTWSNTSRKLLSHISNELSDISTEIQLSDINEQYGFSYKPTNIISAELSNTVKLLANQLYLFKIHNGLVLLKDLLFDDFGASELHALFSLLSIELSNKNNNNILSFHSPIEQSLSDQGFPVHADLFCSRVLLNVITFVEKNNGGDILLLSREQLQKAMHETDLMPRRVQTIILKHLMNRSVQDKFNEVFCLMYGQDKWSSQLIENINKRMIKIPTNPGSGYLLIDGKWLHGRTTINGRVESKRLQRLVFDNEVTSSMPDFTLNISDLHYMKSLMETGEIIRNKAKNNWFKAKSRSPQYSSLSEISKNSLLTNNGLRN